MLILLLLYLASQGWTKDVPHDTNYKFTKISSCPDVGYFFKTVPIPNSVAGQCYLCYCLDDSKAICWQRENKKCDLQHYKHNTTVAKKETRVKRSPLGLSDIFFKDAARDVFNRKEPEVCKPYESSFSEGCPPADWCLGCTVCDCDANGHWDCHILSFCDDDKKGKDHKKGSKKMAVSYPKPRKPTTAKIAKTTKKTPVRSVKTPPKNLPAKRAKDAKLKNQAKEKKEKTPKSNSNKKSRSVIQKGKPAKPLIIKKNEKNPKVVKTSPSKRVMNGTEAQMSEAIMRTMKIVMQQMWNKQVTDALPEIVNMIQKRSFPARFNQTVTQPYLDDYIEVTPKPKPKPKPKSGKGHIYNKSLFLRKKQIDERKKEKQRKRELEEKAAKAKKNNKGKKPAKNNTNRTKRDIHLNNDSDLVAMMKSQTIPDQQQNYSSIDGHPTTTNDTIVMPHIDLDIDEIFADTTIEPLVQNTSVLVEDHRNTSRDTFPSVLNIGFDENSTITNMTSESIMTEPAIYNGSVDDNITTVMDTFSPAYVSSDAAGNSTITNSISDELITTEALVHNSSVDDDIFIVRDTFFTTHNNSDAVGNFTNTQTIFDSSITSEPLSINNLSKSTETISWPHSDAVVNSTNVQLTSEQVTTTEQPVYNTSDEDKVSTITDTSPLPFDTDTTPNTAYTQEELITRTFNNIFFDEKLITTTDISPPYRDTEPEITVDTQSNLDSTTDIITSTYNNSSDIAENSTYKLSTSEKLSAQPIDKKGSVPDNLVTVIDNRLFSNKNYYEYTVNITTEKPEIKNESNYNRTETSVVIGAVANKKHSDYKTEKLKHNLEAEIPNEAENEIKLTKWSEIKTFKDKEKEAGLNSNKTAVLDKIPYKMNETKPRYSKKDQRRKFYTKDVERKVDKTTKKYSLTRVVNSNQYKTKRGGGVKEPDVSRISLSRKIENLRNVLRRLLSEFHKNNTLPSENKRKKTNAIKYLKRFFNKIFCKDSNKTIISQRLRNNNHTIQMLCESFGPCVINRKNKIILMKKIKELNNETIQILKSLRIVKGLLRLVDLPRGLTTMAVNETSNFKKDIHKLNAILKSSDDNDDVMKQLSETQRMQINYIKCNTKVFKQSVARFTKILNQIIDLISLKGNKPKHRKWYSEETLIQDTPNKSGKRNSTKQDKIQKFKQLLHNYNLIHNAFISKIIQMFSSLQDNNLGKSNNTADIIKAEYDSENIVNNLNKLNNLASALNQGKRRKRHVLRQDNGVEYLLMLMEYMLQQNYQLDTTPVNDGIDLLIEAIKNAPDIKTVKKKVLKNNNRNQNLAKEDTPMDTFILNDDNIPNKIYNSSSSDQDTDEVENESDFQTQKASTDTVVSENTEQKLRTSNEAHYIDSNKDSNNQGQLDSKSTNTPSEIDKTTDFEISADKVEKVYIAEGNALDEFDSRLEKSSGELSKSNKFSEFEEDNNVEDATSVPQIANINNEFLTENAIDTTPIQRTNEKPVDIQETTDITTLKPPKKFEKIIDNNETSLEWQEEKENVDTVQVISNTLEEISSTTTGKPNPKAITKPPKKFEVDLSELSKESDEKARVKVKKAEDVYKKKEEDLLNSLDYGTEATLIDAEPRDNEEKFLNDYFGD